MEAIAIVQFSNKPAVTPDEIATWTPEYQFKATWQFEPREDLDNLSAAIEAFKTDHVPALRKNGILSYMLQMKSVNKQAVVQLMHEANLIRTS